jgi:DNA-binding NarL/FixJ family response regulator
MKRMFIVGSDGFLVTAMRLALRYGSGVNVVGILDDDTSIARAVVEAQADIVLVDAGSNPDQAIARLGEARAELPDALLMLITDELDAELFEQAAALGALACLGSAALVPQLQALLAEPAYRAPGAGRVAVTAHGVEPAPEPQPASVAPEHPLTKRELEILRAVAEGHTNARIGRELWVTEQTVKFHLSKIYRKLGVSNRTEASRYALLNDLFATRAPAIPPAPNAVPQVNGHRRALDHARR